MSGDKAISLGNVKVVCVKEIMAANIGYTTGAMAQFNVLERTVEGSLSHLEVIEGPTSDGRLILELKPVLSSRVCFELRLGNISVPSYTTLSINTGKPNEAVIPGFSTPQQMEGPTLFFKEKDILFYNGIATTLLRNFLKPGDKILIFFVGKVILVQNGFGRSSFHIPPSIESDQATIKARFNIEIDNPKIQVTNSKL